MVLFTRLQQRKTTNWPHCNLSAEFLYLRFKLHRAPLASLRHLVNPPPGRVCIAFKVLVTVARCNGRAVLAVVVGPRIKHSPPQHVPCCPPYQSPLGRFLWPTSHPHKHCPSAISPPTEQPNAPWSVLTGPTTTVDGQTQCGNRQFSEDKVILDPATTRAFRRPLN